MIENKFDCKPKLITAEIGEIKLQEDEIKASNKYPYDDKNGEWVYLFEQKPTINKNEEEIKIEESAKKIIDELFDY
ncbi:MAG: hypothetical protein MHPSP_003507, partial [Paramarteilia canceri]